MSAACRIREGTVVPIGGHGAPVAVVIVACIHEHVTEGLPVCAACLERHVAETLCCVACELQAPAGTRHCCPVTLHPEVTA